MIKAIIFDFDGTLSNRNLNAHIAYTEYLKQYFPDVEGIEYEAIIQDMITDDMNGTVNMKYRIAPFKAKYNLSDEFEEKFIKFWDEKMYVYTVLKPDTIDVLNELKKNYKIGILTNGNSVGQHNKVNKFNFDKLMDAVVVSGDYGIHKPDKKIFEIACEKIGEKPEDCIYVGDVFSNDIMGSSRAGMTPVWITADSERPSGSYTGYRIENLTQLLDVLKKINN